MSTRVSGSGVVPLWKPVRLAMRNAIVGVVRRVFATDDGRGIAEEALRGLLRAGAPFTPDDPLRTHQVYAELGRPRAERPARRGRPIFITGRFRSGSTLLWNIFRQVDGCTAYYEPFNERRWFEPAARGSRVDTTHLGVTDYWREYDGLEHLGQHYDERWSDRHLYMEADAWNPAMKAYVRAIIAAAPRRAVLQFNRIDFRLPWFRANFPDATIVHLFRNPRDQWCSSLVDPRSFPSDRHLSQFEPHDHFYLLNWARDLKYRFPFLDERFVTHPYQLFYFIWKLSYLFGVEYAHYSIALEHLVRNPERELLALMRAVDIDTFDLNRLERCVADQRPGKWRDYADNDWFAAHESWCETVLDEFFGVATASTDREVRRGGRDASARVLRIPGAHA